MPVLHECREETSDEAAVLHYTYNRFDDLKSRRDRCDCAPTEEDAKRCFILPFDRMVRPCPRMRSAWDPAAVPLQGAALYVLSELEALGLPRTPLNTGAYTGLQRRLGMPVPLSVFPISRAGSLL